MVSRNYCWAVTNPRLLDDLLLSRSAMDRAAHRRIDVPWQAARRSDSSSLAMWVNGSATAVLAGGSAPSLVLTPLTAIDDLASLASLSFLGIDEDGRAYYAVHLESQEQGHPALPPQVEWSSLRRIGSGLSDLDAGLSVAAVALDNWRARTRWCTMCGKALSVEQAGWSLRCADDSINHFPRTDPAVIVLVRDPLDRALLGRHVDWPAGTYSTFAGFVEAGESAEAAVRRELAEETGVVIDPGTDDLMYLGSQPWPFPCSLMLGYHAWTAQTDITVDGEEIAEARWFTREELLEGCTDGSVRLPSSVSISRRLIERWYGSVLPGEWSR